MTVRTLTSYGALVQTLHWLTAILVVLAFATGLGGSELRIYATAHDFERQLHETLGVCVLVLLALRLYWRISSGRLRIAVSHWTDFASAAVHTSLYLLLLFVPLTAIVGAWLEGHPLTLVTGVVLPAPVPAAHSLGATLASVHTWLGDAIVWLAGMHAMAGLYHHYILRDQVLASMLPRWLLQRIGGAAVRERA